MPTDDVNLRNERLHAEQLWRGSLDGHVPLAVAAAMAFHRVCGSTRTIVTRQDYDDALNIAATALSRLIPIYCLEDPRAGRAALAIDLIYESFIKGATRLRVRDGSMRAGLTVLRSDLIGAVAQLRSSGLPLFLADGMEAAAGPLSPRTNALLAALPEDAYAELAGHLELVPLGNQAVLYTEGSELRHLYFPVSGLISLLYITQDGAPTEIAIVGNDGVVGLAVVLGAGSTPRRAIVQIAGYAYRAAADALLAQFHGGGPLHDRLLRYVQALMMQISQTAVCNRHHKVEQQLCRWLLMSLDRVASNEVLMTQEGISHMLGVRRSGITSAATTLQQAGVIRYSRGCITVPDRSRLEAHACECYAVVKQETDRLLSRKTRVASL